MLQRDGIGNESDVKGCLIAGFFRHLTRPADFARLVHRNQRVDSVLPIVAATEEASKNVKPEFGVRSPRLTLALGKVPAVVSISMAGDPARLQQVVWNLLSNAVKFTPSAGQIDVTLARSGPDFELRVSDTGQGVAPDFLPHLFDRFRQADSSSSRSHGGLG